MQVDVPDTNEVAVNENPEEHIVRLPRRFCPIPGRVFDQVRWEIRSAEIRNPETDEVVFKADDLEFPASWSRNCTALVAEKYFRYVEQKHTNGVTKIEQRRETSVRQMIDRVATTLTKWGLDQGYFGRDHDAAAVFRDELSAILLFQRAAFNSPVWFNVGTRRGRLQEEQCSACFINSVADDMGSILELSQIEGWLYKGGSGSGVNYSPLRSSRETLSGGGFASGPVPFMCKDDANAGAIKSGGTTRRAAKMGILNVDHGDILEFIRCKPQAEKAAQALIGAGFDKDFRARWGAYAHVPFQNANLSVRVTDEFMQAVENDEDWDLLARYGGEVLETLRARDIFDEICEAAYHCGDPGLQFDTTINRWHTTPADGRINASNPCSEFMYLDDSACNLASINLMPFLQDDGSFDIGGYEHTVDVLITAMDIIVDAAGYPTEKIRENSSKYRPLGLGFTNLGALLMAQGLPYDSDAARLQASCLTSLMTARAYRQSSILAEVRGPFETFEANRASMMQVIGRHRTSGLLPAQPNGSADLYAAAQQTWVEAQERGHTFGYRNSQTTLMAPTGTISFLMDCDTTSIEPDLTLIKSKKLVGGGTITMANAQVGAALDQLGYTKEQIARIVKYVGEKGSIFDAPDLQEAHLEVFDTSLPDVLGKRCLRPEAHLLMMAAVQPYISGAISKTCNIPNDATKEDIANLYTLAWRSGLKSVALYRDGSKESQPLSVESKESKDPPREIRVRHKLPRDCDGPRHKFEIGPHEGYLHTGLYEDGTPGEIFVRMSKTGSTVSGMMDAWAIMVSMSLQYGVPLEKICEKFAYTAFEPSGWSPVKEIGFAHSVLDYVARYLKHRFLDGGDEPKPSDEPVPTKPTLDVPIEYDTGMTCPACGHTTQRTGSCCTCGTCGWNQGCG